MPREREVVLEVGLEHAGKRLDRFLHERIPRLSRTRIRGIVENGQVSLDGGPAEVGRRVRVGQRVVVRRPARPEPPAILHVRTIHRDDDVLVIEKPGDLTVHPTARYHHHTLTALLRRDLGPDHGYALAHRLDRETSGVLVLGRGPARAALERAFQRREVEKRYLACVHGRLERSGRIEAPIGPAIGSLVRIKYGVRSLEQGGAPASTEYEPVAHGSFRGEPITLLRVLPRTGRTHQIRVHLCHLGHPVVGDKLYGLDERWFADVADGLRPMADLVAHTGIHRHALHAEWLGFRHPGHGGWVEYAAPWPDDLAAVLAVG